MRRGRAQLKTDLFPFLSVLCSVIGVLMLFLVAILTTRIVDNAEATERQTPYTPILIPSDIGPEKDGIPEEQWQELNERLDDVSESLQESLEQEDELTQLSEVLREVLESKELEALAQEVTQTGPIPLDTPEEVTIIADKTAPTDKRPFFVEVKADGYVVHGDNGDEATYPVIQESEVRGQKRLQAHSSLERFLKREVFSRREKRFLLFLLHPNGIDSLEKMRSYLREKYGKKMEERTRRGNTLYIRTWTEDRIGVGVEPFSPHLKMVIEQLRASSEE